MKRKRFLINSVQDYLHLDDLPLSIAGRIVEYLERTNTHKMFRSVMRKDILDVVCRKEIMPLLRDITVLPHKEGLGGRSC